MLRHEGEGGSGRSAKVGGRKTRCDECLQAGAQIGDARAVKALCARLEDSNREVRREVVAALSRIENRGALPALKARLRVERDQTVREIIGPAIQQIEVATRPWKDVPLPAQAALHGGADLPLPAQPPSLDRDSLPVPSGDPEDAEARTRTVAAGKPSLLARLGAGFRKRGGKGS
jgi:hypothetical protein